MHSYSHAWVQVNLTHHLDHCLNGYPGLFVHSISLFFSLSVGALVGLSIAAVVLFAFIITVCVLCYLFISTKPRSKLDTGLSLQMAGKTSCYWCALSPAEKKPNSVFKWMWRNPTVCVFSLMGMSRCNQAILLFCLLCEMCTKLKTFSTSSVYLFSSRKSVKVCNTEWECNK